MKIVFCLLFSWSWATIFAQSPSASLTIFSEKGDKFFVYINGQKINNEPMSKVKVADLPYVFYAVKVEYDDASHYTINKDKLFVCNKKGELRDFTYELVREDSEMKLKFVSMKIPAAKTDAGEKFVFSYSGKSVQEQKNEIAASATKNKEMAASKENQLTGNFSNTEAKELATIIKSGKKDSVNNVIVEKNNIPEPTEKKPAVSETVQVKTTIDEENAGVVNALVLMEPRNWVCKSEWPMLKSDYEKTLNEIAAMSTDADKLKVSKELASKNCLKADQVSQVALLIRNEAERLEFVKFSYPHTIDIKNYQKLSKLFSEDKNKSSFVYFITH